MKNFFYKTIEKAFNHYLALDPESKHRLLFLDDKTILLKLNGLPFDEVSNFTLYIQSGKINFINDSSRAADVMIKGTPLSLLHMSITKQNRKQFFAEDVVIEGDLELGQQIIDLFDELEIDWEEHSSKLIGDVAAHQVGRFVRGVKQVMSRFNESILQNVNEYVHEEALLFPPKEALQDFFNDIDQLRMDADRLEAKVKQLSQYKNSEEM